MTSSTNHDFIEKVNAFCNLVNNTNPYNILDIELMKKNLLGIYDELLQITPVASSPEEEIEQHTDMPSEETTEPLSFEKVEENPQDSISESDIKEDILETPDSQVLFDTEDPFLADDESSDINETPASITETSNDNIVNTTESSSTVHDILTDMQQNDDMLTVLAKQQISNLTKAITINDKIEFVRELFDGDAETYKTVISKLDQSKNLDEAMGHLNKLELDKEKPSTEKLIKLVYRRFI